MASSGSSSGPFASVTEPSTPSGPAAAALPTPGVLLPGQLAGSSALASYAGLEQMRLGAQQGGPASFLPIGLLPPDQAERGSPLGLDSDLGLAAARGNSELVFGLGAGRLPAHADRAEPLRSPLKPPSAPSRPDGSDGLPFVAPLGGSSTLLLDLFAALSAAMLLSAPRLAQRGRARSLLIPGTPHYLLPERPG